MRIDRFTFGSIRIDGETYAHDVVIDRGQVRKRKKKRSKPFRDAFGHTPLSIEEDIPWNCRRQRRDRRQLKKVSSPPQEPWSLHPRARSAPT